MTATYTDNGTNTPNGSHLEFTYTFPVLLSTDVKVSLNGVTQATTKYTVSTSPAKITFNNTSVDATLQESTGAPKTGVAVRVYRHTGVGKTDGNEDPKAVFAAGSSIRAADLNNNFEQLLFAAHEAQEQTIDSEDITAGAVINAAIGADAVDGTKLADNAVDSEHYTDASIDTAHIADDQVTYAKIQNVSATDRVLGRDSSGAGIIEEITPANLRTMLNIEDGATGNQSNAEIRAAVEAATDSNVFTDADHSKLNAIEASATADQTDAEIRAAVEAATDSNVFTDADHTKLNGIAASANNYSISSDLLDEDDFATDSATKVPSQQSTKAYIGTYAQPKDADLTTLAGMQSGTASILASGTALTSTTAELNLLDGKSIVTTISSPTDVQIPTAQAVDERITTVLSDVGGFVPIADKDSFPETNPDPGDNAGTIVSIADAGGLVVNGSGVSTTGDTITTNATVTINGIDSTLHNTTIAAGKGMLIETTSTLNTYTYHRLIVDEAGVASAQTLVTDFNQRYQVAGSTPSNQPDGTALAEGDLWFDTAANTMKVYDGSQYNVVTSVGDYKLLTVVPDGATSGTPDYTNVSFDLRDGGSAASITSVGQLLVSVNGVLQKPNSTSWSASNEGFHLEGTDGIKFCTAPGAGASVFVTLIGSATSVNVPATNSIVEAAIQTNVVSEEKLKISNAGSNGQFLSKQSGNTGGLTWASVTSTPEGTAILSTGESGGTKFLREDGDNSCSWQSVPADATKMPLAGGTFTGDVTWDNGTNAGMDMVWDESDDTLKFSDDVQISLGSDRDMRLYHTGSHAYFNVVTGDLNIRTASNESAIVCTANAGVATYYNNVKKTETTNTGLTVTGTLAATAVTGDGSGLTGLAAGATGGNSGANAIFWENEQTVTHDYTIGNNKNAGSFGPITINSGVTVTVGSGENWTIV